MATPQGIGKLNCFDCNKPFSSTSDDPSSPEESELMQPDLENEEIDRKIAEISLIPFNVKSCICLNCIDKYVKFAQKNSQVMANEKELLIQAMKNQLLDINCKELIEMKDSESNSLLQKKQKELALIKQEQKKYDKTASDLTEQLSKLIKEEEDLWSEISSLHLQKEEIALEDSIDAIQYDHLKKKAEALLKPIKLSELFKIEIINKSAYINDFTLNQSKFNLNEINYSIGQLAYLIAIINDKVGYGIDKFSIYSIGERSRLLDKPQKKMFDLFLLSNSNRDIALFNEGIKVFISYIFDLIKYINNSHKTSFDTTNDNNLNVFKFSIEALASWSGAMSCLFDTIKNIIEDPRLDEVFNNFV